MMREIKYRAYTKEYGVQSVRELVWNRYRSIVVVSLSNEISVLTNRGIGKDIVVEQYTGMEDEGNAEIFEGDILKDIDDGTIIGSVEYIDDCATYWCGTMPLSDVAKDSHVCGNIHEDKELLGDNN